MIKIEKIKNLFIENCKRTKCKWLDILILTLVTVLAVLALTDVLGLLSTPVRKIFFPLLSIWANLMIYKMIKMVMSIRKIRLEKYQWMLIISTIAVTCVFYVIIVLNRDFIYFWDYSNYIVKQYDTEKAFAESIVGGIKYLFASFVYDYTNFINIYTEIPFCLTSKTGDAYVLSQFFNVYIPILILLSVLIVKLGEIFKVKNKKIFFVLSLIVTVTLPLLHSASLFGQPDWFGVIFCLVIVVLTVDYKFEK